MKKRQQPLTSEELHTRYIDWKLGNEGVRAERIMNNYYGLSRSKGR